MDCHVEFVLIRDGLEIRKVSIQIRRKKDWEADLGDSTGEDQAEASWCFSVKVLNLVRKSIHSPKQVRSFSAGAVPFLALVLELQEERLGNFRWC